MPTPFYGDCQGSNRVLPDNPGLASLIGVICGIWSNIEASMAFDYTMLVFGCRDVQDGGEAIAMEAFESLLSAHQKRNFLIAAAKHRGFPQQTVDHYGKLLKRIADLALERNAVVHGRRASSEQKPDCLVWMKRLGDTQNMQLYSAQDFAAIIGRLSKAQEDLSAFFTDQMIPHLKRVAETYVANILAAEQRKGSL